MDEVISLFPTPLLRVPGGLDRTLVAALVAHFATQATRDNNSASKNDFNLTLLATTIARS